MVFLGFSLVANYLINANSSAKKMRENILNIGSCVRVSGGRRERNFGRTRRERGMI